MFKINGVILLLALFSNGVLAQEVSISSANQKNEDIKPTITERKILLKERAQRQKEEIAHRHNVTIKHPEPVVKDVQDSQTNIVHQPAVAEIATKPNTNNAATVPAPAPAVSQPVQIKAK